MYRKFRREVKTSRYLEYQRKEIQGSMTGHNGSINVTNKSKVVEKKNPLIFKGSTVIFCSP